MATHMLPHLLLLLQPPLSIGHALPGYVGGSVTEVLAGLLLVSGLTTEVVKFAQGMQVRVAHYSSLSLASQAAVLLGCAGHGRPQSLWLKQCRPATLTCCRICS